MNYTSDDIIGFIVHKTGCSEHEVSLTSDLDNDLGCTGDDFHELMDEFAKTFGVDMNSYRWYFHTVEEGHLHSIGRLFFNPPSERVKHIAVTPSILLDSAISGRWIINYPEHLLPKRRFDLLINKFLFFGIILFLIFLMLKVTWK